MSNPFWASAPEVEALCYKIDQHLLGLLKKEEESLAYPLQDLAQSGGKRIRPLMTMLCAGWGDAPEEELLNLACAIEILHLATLVHDDIIDQSKLRRGRPALYRLAGKRNAILLGDYLLSFAVELVSRNTTLAQGETLAKGIKAIVAGEIQQSRDRYKLIMSPRQSLKKILRKTGALFILSCYAGSEKSGTSETLGERFRRIGYSIGVAFQLQDDLLDLHGDRHKVGKPVGWDLLNGYYTLPLVLASQENPKLRKYLSQGRSGRFYRGRLLRAYGATGAERQTNHMIAGYMKRALNEINQLPEHPNKQYLKQMIQLLLKRDL